MPSTPLSAPTHPQDRRGAISVPQGQTLVDYTQQQNQAVAPCRFPAAYSANTQPEQQATAGAEAPEGYRSWPPNRRLRCVDRWEVCYRRGAVVSAGRSNAESTSPLLTFWLALR